MEIGSQKELIYNFCLTLYAMGIDMFDGEQLTYWQVIGLIDDYRKRMNRLDNKQLLIIRRFVLVLRRLHLSKPGDSMFMDVTAADFLKRIDKVYA